MCPLAEFDTAPLKTSRAAVFLAPGSKLRLEQFACPVPATGEVLVRVECCTVCGSDLHTITGKRAEKTPTILGHEICGRIVALSSNPVRDLNDNVLRLGDRVTWSVSVSCGHCDRCQGGLPQKCRTLRKFGHESTRSPWPLSGGLSEYVHLPVGTQICRLPEDLPANVVCPANCATATVAAACRMAGDLRGKRVLIFGAGMLGLTATAWSRSCSASRIVICDQDESRLAWATRFGADAGIMCNTALVDSRNELLREYPEIQAFDIILELSGSPDAIELGCSLCDIGAKLILVGTVMKSRPVQIDPEMLVRRWISIHGVHNYTPDDLRSAVRFLADNQHHYPFHELIERTFQLEDINAAIDYAIQRRPIRIAIMP